MKLVRSWAVPGLLFLLALVLRLGIILWWQFDGLYGQDAYAYFSQAVALSENLPQGRLPPVNFFWPNGYPLLVAGFMLPAGPIPLAGQLVALVGGSILPALLYLLGRDLGRGAGLAGPAGWPAALAGLVVALAGQPLLSSVVIMADMPALAWATLAVWCTVRALGVESLSGKTVAREQTTGRRAALAWFLAAGAALALAITSRWIYGLLVPGLVLYVLTGLRRAGLSLGQAAAAGLSGAALLGPQLWLSQQRPGGLLHSWLTGWQPANFLARRFENIDGYFVYPLPNAVFYAQPAGHPAYLFPLLGLAAGWGLWRLARAGRWRALGLLLGWAGPVYLFLAGIPYQNFRFGLSLYPPLVLLAGLGLADWMGETLPGSSERWRVRAVGGLAALSLVGMLLWAYPMLDNFLAGQNRSKVIARQVEETLPAEATVLAFGLTLTLQHYTHLNTLELFYLEPANLGELLQTPGPLYLLLDPANVEKQWPGRPPGVNYDWLRRHAVLRRVADFPPYVLWQVERQ